MLLDSLLRSILQEENAFLKQLRGWKNRYREMIAHIPEVPVLALLSGGGR